jgi:hypothetical protein
LLGGWRLDRAVGSPGGAANCLGPRGCNRRGGWPVRSHRKTRARGGELPPHRSVNCRLAFRAV